MCFFNLQAQEELEWSKDLKLSWQDFKGKVPDGSFAAATTASGISYQFSTAYNKNELKVDFEVNSFFYPNKSWYKPGVANEWTLIHEQIHFDITEIYARKMRKELSITNFTKNIKAEVREIYKRTLRQLNDFQNKYDSQTDYSRNIPVQEKWILDIQKELSKE